ncbi:PEP-CTERM sorting domain-containing protein [Duganella callida]|uniref:Ice-binding protein C-terminal domain-containing protein n=1 Tax=Duganella callida TaxID=2561932 RepID=A0A4Y9SSW9_9BURK|nr:PEP-CTERM sorting domain-containing protein [Duganella callida]TFW29790.1 hypothetical protein E4L98_03330 [Duganella callida]
MQIKTALKAATIAATLAFASTGHAAINYSNAAAGMVLDGEGSMLNPIAPGVGVMGVEVYDLTGTTLGADILAFCIQPTVAQLSGTVYSQSSFAQGSASLAALNTSTYSDRDYKVKALFESQYKNLSTGNADTDTQSRLAFQLALWDIVADDGKYNTGLQSFSGDALGLYGDNGDTFAVTQAEDMLKAVDQYGPLKNLYNYTSFNGVANGQASQQLLSVTAVAAVPEADTWAMLAVGLGLLGLTARRKSRSEKFEA